MDSRLLQPSYIKELCRRYGFSPQKSLGQNYLVSALPVNAMIAAGELTPDDTVIEIGPGFGVLTLALSPLVRRVVAFEIEQTLRPYWEERCREYPNITVIWGEAIYELAKYQSELRGLRSYKVLANLPYQITSYALRTVLELEPPPERAVVMVQREVADRLSAGPGDMSLLSASVQYYGQPRITARVPRGSFWPPPQVDSAIVAIGGIEKRRSEIRCSGVEPAVFFRYIRAGFGHKRKQLAKNIAAQLAPDPETVKKALRALSRPETVRAEELSVGEWLELITLLEAAGR